MGRRHLRRLFLFRPVAGFRPRLSASLRSLHFEQATLLRQQKACRDDHIRVQRRV